MKQIFILCLLVPFVIGTSNYCSNYNEFRYNLVRAVNTNLKELTHNYDVNNDHYIDILYHINAIFRIMSHYDSHYNKHYDEPLLYGKTNKHISNSGSVSGSTSGSVSGSVSGGTTGSVSGGTSGSVSGSTSGSVSGSTSGSVSGSTSGSVSGSVSGGTSGSVSGSTSGSVSGGTSGSVSGSTSGSVSGGTSGSVSGSVSGGTSGLVSTQTYVTCLDAFYKSHKKINGYYNIDPDFKHVNNSFNTFCYQENLNNFGNGWTLNGFLMNKPSDFKNTMSEYKHDMQNNGFLNISNVFLPKFNENVFVTENQITSYNQVLEVVVDNNNNLYFFFNNTVNSDDLHTVYHQYAISDSIRRSNRLFDRIYCSYNNYRVNNCAYIMQNIMSQKINIDNSGEILANTNELGFSKNIVKNWRFKYLFLK